MRCSRCACERTGNINESTTVTKQIKRGSECFDTFAISITSTRNLTLLSVAKYRQSRLSLWNSEFRRALSNGSISQVAYDEEHMFSESIRPRRSQQRLKKPLRLKH